MRTSPQENFDITEEEYDEVMEELNSQPKNISISYEAKLLTLFIWLAFFAKVASNYSTTVQITIIVLASVVFALWFPKK